MLSFVSARADAAFPAARRGARLPPRRKTLAYDLAHAIGPSVARLGPWQQPNGNLRLGPEQHRCAPGDRTRFTTACPRSPQRRASELIRLVEDLEGSGVGFGAQRLVRLTCGGPRRSSDIEPSLDYVNPSQTGLFTFPRKPWVFVHHSASPVVPNRPKAYSRRGCIKPNNTT